MKKHNFSPGPSVLPQEVLSKSAEAVVDFNGNGLSLIEMSHRDKDIIAVMDQAQDLVLDLLNLKNKNYHALFLQGGASLQFLMVAYNLLEKEAAYIDTGTWASKAFKEASYLGKATLVASSKDKNYNYIPKGYTIPSEADYLHITTNNTIFGTQFFDLPQTSVPLVADMSSDIFSTQRDFSKFGLLYAGAQKNMGPAGITLVVVREDLLGRVSRKIPSMLNYALHLENKSMYNTPPVFALYVSMLTLKWLKEKGGVSEIEKINRRKAGLLYDEIERNPLFTAFANKDDRSLMNVVFNLKDESQKDRFDKLWKAAGIYNLEGHRSVGGYRASIYNALPVESVQVLADVMRQFEKTA